MARVATVLACQDVRLEYDGKLTVVGVFTTNIGVPAPMSIPQMWFLVNIEGDLSEQLESLSLHIHLPGVEEPVIHDVPDIVAPRTIEGQTRWRHLLPLQITNMTLNPGRIRFRLIHDKGEIETGAGWIVLNDPPSGTSASEPQPPSSQSESDVSRTG